MVAHLFVLEEAAVADPLPEEVSTTHLLRRFKRNPRILLSNPPAGRCISAAATQVPQSGERRKQQQGFWGGGGVFVLVLCPPLGAAAPPKTRSTKHRLLRRSLLTHLSSIPG